MSLPVIQSPTYEVKLISQPKPVVYRPYLVKEEKILMMAQQGDDPKEIERAVRQVMTNCTFGNMNINALPSFDIEYLFLQLRAKSVNDVIEVKFECQNKVGADERCRTVVPISINISDIKLTVPEGHTNKIQLSDDIGIVLRYPTGETFDVFGDKDDADIVEVLTHCIDKIYTTSGDVYEASEASPAELQSFIESLSVPQVEKIRQFFETMPHLTHTFEFKCPKCGYAESVTLSGLMDFFD